MIETLTGINNCFTRPKYQGQGMAGTLIEWGVRKADELGLEAHVEASPKEDRYTLDMVSFK